MTTSGLLLFSLYHPQSWSVLLNDIDQGWKGKRSTHDFQSPSCTKFKLFLLSIQNHFQCHSTTLSVYPHCIKCTLTSKTEIHPSCQIFSSMLQFRSTSKWVLSSNRICICSLWHKVSSKLSNKSYLSVNLLTVITIIIKALSIDVWLAQYFY